MDSKCRTLSWGFMGYTKEKKSFPISSKINILRRNNKNHKNEIIANCKGIKYRPN